jgi:enhancing lycopene biosynthesis protein 2
MQIQQQLTNGSKTAASPYVIADFQAGLHLKGAQTTECNIDEICIDTTNRIITAPCYMLEATLPELQRNIAKAFNALQTLLEA